MCGGGIQTRTAQCVNLQNNEPVDEKNCVEIEKVTKKECTNNECPKWFTTDWSRVSLFWGKNLPNIN